MQKILFKRSLRNLKSNWLSYLALFLLLIFCMMMVVANNSVADTLMIRTKESHRQNHLEDGEFTTTVPLTSSEIKSIQDSGISIEKIFNQDYVLEDKSTLRLFKNRENINLITLISGELASSSDEVVIERRYAEVRKIKVGDSITIADKSLKISGIGVAPDYECVLVDNTTSFTDPNAFGIAFLTNEGYDSIKATNKAKNSETYLYSYILGKDTDVDTLSKKLDTFKITVSDIKALPDVSLEDAFLLGMPKVQFILEAKDNLRVAAAYNDQIVNKETGLFAGVLILILISYILSIFVSHEIHEDSSVIGTLYALGVTRRDLLLHYLYVPLFVVFTGGLVGCLIGFSPMVNSMQLAQSYDYFSLPNLPPLYPGYLIAFATIVPVIICALVNIITILVKLNKPVLALIHKEEKKVKKESKVKLTKLNFTKKFQLRQFLREGKASMAVIGGMFIALLVLMLCLNCHVMCNNLVKGAENDVTFEYIYTYKYPTKEVPEGGEECYGETFMREKYGYEFNVSLLGIKSDNPYFKVDKKLDGNNVVVTSAMAQKFKIKVGDTLEFARGDKNYSFKVIGIHEFSPSFYMFMDLEDMRTLFDADSNYFNVVLSDKALDIPNANLYATTTKGELIKASELVVEIMKPMVSMLIFAAIVIFIMVMYLMLKMMLDKSKHNISLLGVLGYTPNEVRKLYLDGNFFVVLIGSLITVPLAKLVMDMFYPLMCSNLACAIDTVLPWFYYPIIIVATMVLFIIINALLIFKIKRINPSDVIKNRE